MAKKKKDDDSKYEPGGMAFVGFLMLGLAIGIYTGQTAVGVLGGLGLGFIAMAILVNRKI
jgi:hypothetical protein